MKRNENLQQLKAQCKKYTAEVKEQVKDEVKSTVNENIPVIS
jgi:uncharacterized protein YjbJ (UPF0337 family)